MSIAKAVREFKKHLKQLEKTRDSLRELYDEIESSVSYAENACSDLWRIIDDLSEIV